MPLRSTDDPDFDARWAAWLARGAAHERLTRRRFTVLGPATFVAVVIVYLFFIR